MFLISFILLQTIGIILAFKNPLLVTFLFHSPSVHLLVHLFLFFSSHTWVQNRGKIRSCSLLSDLHFTCHTVPVVWQRLQGGHLSNWLKVEWRHHSLSLALLLQTPTAQTKTSRNRKQCDTISTTTSLNPSGATENGQHYPSSVTWDWFGRLCTEQWRLLDRMEVYLLSFPRN